MGGISAFWNFDSFILPSKVVNIRGTAGVPPPPLAECEDSVQTDPDGSQIAADNLSCPLPTKGAETSDDSWLVMVSRGRSDICIHAMKFKSQNMLTKTLWSKGINLSGFRHCSPTLKLFNQTCTVYFYTLNNSGMLYLVSWHTSTYFIQWLQVFSSTCLWGVAQKRGWAKAIFRLYKFSVRNSF